MKKSELKLNQTVVYKTNGRSFISKVIGIFNDWVFVLINYNPELGTTKNIDGKLYTCVCVDPIHDLNKTNLIF